MAKNPTVDTLDLIVSKRAEFISLPAEVQNSNICSESAPSMTDAKYANAIQVLDQQMALISGLQLALNRSVKVAAALAEAAKLAEDGVIDSSDVISHARQALEDDRIKMSSVNDIFNQSPGELIGDAVVAAAASASADPLTQYLRNSR